MRISSKLYGLVAVSLFGLLVNAGLNFQQFVKVSDDVQQITKNSIPSMKALTGIRSQINDSRRALLKQVLAVSVAEKNEQRAVFDKASATAAQRLADYQAKMISDDQDRQNVEQVTAMLPQYIEVAHKIFALSDANKIDEARSVIARESTSLSTQLVGKMSKAAEYNSQLADNYAQLADDTIRTGRLLMIGLVSALSVALLLAGVLIVRQIRRPLGVLQSGMVQLSQDFDFTRRIEHPAQDEIGDTVRAVNHLLESLQKSLSQVLQVGDNIHASATEVASASQQMSRATQHVSESTSSMSAAVEQMTVSVNHVAEQASQANDSGQEAGGQARDGSAVVHRTIDIIRATADTVGEASTHIDALKEQTAKIDAVVGVIRDIADQTNLLALNAAIEAARAGEQGRGFAVVADEVRKLAERTTSSTQEISGMIQSIQSGAGQTVSAMQEVVGQVETGVKEAEFARAAIDKILSGTDVVVEQVGQISNAMREQSQASTNIAQQIEKVAQMTEESNAGTQMTAASAQHLQQQADALHEAISHFKV